MEQISQQRIECNTRIFSVSQRVACLTKLSEALRLHESEIMVALQQDLGKSEGEAYLVELFMVYSEIKLMIKKCEAWSKPRKVTASAALFGSTCTIEPQPYGQVLIISPWNYPIQLALMPLVGAIAAGNYVVLKLSESAKQCNAILKKIIATSFSDNEVIVYEGGKEVNEQILSHQFDYIFFTGSTQFGKEIMRIAAKNLTPVTLELGGKSPVVVTAQCDLEVAAKRIAWGKTLNAGQTCVAPDYLLVEKQVEQKLIERILFYWETFYGKNPKESPLYCKLITREAALRAAKLLEGEEIIHGGIIDIENRYVQPTLVRITDGASALMQEEIFAPILPIITFEQYQEAIDFINEREKPLALYIFGNQREASQIITNTSSGSVAVNDTIVQITNHNQPFGGVGASGMGAYHGKYSFDTFTHYRSVLYASKRADLPIKYPPYKLSKWLKWLMLKMG